MSRHVIVGKGPIGTTLAHHLADAGHEVLVVSRSGAGGTPGRDAGRPGIRHVALEASDAAALSRARHHAGHGETVGQEPGHADEELRPPTAADHTEPQRAAHASRLTRGLRESIWRPIVDRSSAGTQDHDVTSQGP